MRQSIVTLDMEGVLTPEIWVAVAEKAGVPELRLTTRDEPDYDKLMRYRLDLLNKYGLRLSDIQAVIGSLGLLDGSKAFLDELRTLCPVVILSDTFEQFASPLIHQLDWPALMCHRLEVQDDQVVGYRLRLPDQKRQAVLAFKGLNYRVIAAGDSFNDSTMLCEADVGILFKASVTMKEQFPKFETAETHPQLLGLIRGVLGGGSPAS